LTFDFSRKGASVDGVAHRGCREHRQMVDGNGAGEGDKAAQIDQGKGNPFRVQPARRRDPAPQPAHDLFIEKREYCGAEPLEDDEAQRVRAKIDNADALGRKWISIEHPLSARRVSGGLAAAPCRALTSSGSS